MKLSDIRGERTLEVIADIIDPVASIAGSDAAKELFRRERLPQGVSAREFMLGRIRRVLPRLLREHKTDLLTILSAIEGKPCEEYAEGLDLVSLTVGLMELFSDRAFMELFTQAQTGGSSGSAPESTGAP